MKVITVKPEFQPVIITLETQEEVDQMFALVNFNSFSDEAIDITCDIFDLLEELHSGNEYAQLENTNCFYKVEE